MGIGAVGLTKLGAHPLLLDAELNPEYEENEAETDKSAHLREGDCGAKEPGQKAGVDGVPDHRIGSGGDQFVTLLYSDGAAPVAAEVLSGPDGEGHASDHNASPHPKWPQPLRPELKIEPGQRDARCQKQDDRDQVCEGAQDARCGGLETLGSFRTDGFDLPIDEKGDPENGKERLVEPEHARPPGAENITQPGQRKFRCHRAFAGVASAKWPMEVRV